MESLKKVLIGKGMSTEEAKEEMEMLREDMLEYIEVGDFNGAEEVLLYSGVDLDYIEELLGF